MMNHKNVFALFTMLVISLSSLVSLAQDEQKKYQGVLVWEDHVFPSKAKAYEEAVKMQMEIYVQHNFPHAVNIYSSNDYRYFWTIQIERFADIDTLYKEFNKIYKDASEEINQKLEDAFDGTYGYSTPWTCVRHLDLSYTPEIKTEGATDFRSWGFCYAKMGKGEEMREVFKKWAELYQRHNIERGFSTYVGDVGTDMPLVFWSISDVDPAAYYSNSKKINETLGEESKALWEETEAIMRKFDNLTGWHRQDLSYKPSE